MGTNWTTRDIPGPEVQQRLWAVSEDLTGVTSPV